MNRTRISTGVALTMLGLMFSVGLALDVLFFPLLSEELAANYVEYHGDRLVMQVLLTAVVVCGQLSFVAIAVLLVRVRRNQLLEPSTRNFVSLLTGSFFAAGMAAVGLLVWLMQQNTMPPALLIFLVLSVCLAITAGLVTLALLDVLNQAISDREELAGVI